MDWNPDYRYKMLGKLVRSNGELFFVFDLNNAEIFRRTIKDDGKVKSSRTPVYPESWKNQFGLSVEEHKKAMQINFFDDYAVFSLQAEPSKPNSPINIPRIKESEANPYEQSNITTPTTGITKNDDSLLPTYSCN